MAKKNIRRVCLYGGPGLGKSTTGAWLFSELKVRGLDVEFVTEYVKKWAYLKRAPRDWDQPYLLAKQMHNEDMVLRDTNSIVVSESPLFLGVAYAKHYKSYGWKESIPLCLAFEKHYPALNLLLQRGDCPYNTNGRFQDYEQAIEMDHAIKRGMDYFGIKYVKVEYNDRTLILNTVLASIK